MAILERGDARIHYQDTGAPASNSDAPVIVFGHGLLFSHWLFHPQIEALKDSYRCVAIDWRGQGGTNDPAGDYDMDTLTDDVLALIQDLGLGPVHYVGLSMGGFVGLRLGARHGELLTSLTLLDTSAMGEDEANKGKYRLLSRVYRLLGIKVVAKQVYPIMFSPVSIGNPDFQPVIQEWIRQLSGVKRSGMVKAIAGVVDRRGVESELGSITVPTLIVVGADDAATPVHKSQFIADNIPGSRLEIVADCGHSSTLEKPEAITELIRSFVAAN